MSAFSMSLASSSPGPQSPRLRPGSPDSRSARRRLDRRALDLVTVVTSPRDDQVEPGPMREAVTRLDEQRMRAQLRIDDAEAGRPPRRLPDTLDAVRLQPGEHFGHRRAREPPALDGGEVVADRALNLADRIAEGGVLLLGERRQETEQHEVREACGARLGESVQRTKCSDLGLARQAAARAVEHQEHAPGRREVQASDHGRMTVAAAAPAVDDESAVLERTDADPGARAAVGERRECRQGHLHVVQFAERRAHGERELRTGPEPDVRRDRAPYGDRRTAFYVVSIDQTPEVIEGSVRAFSVCGDVVTAPQLDVRRKVVERETEAAEAAAQTAAYVDEAEMEARRRTHSDRQAVELRAVRGTASVDH